MAQQGTGAERRKQSRQERKESRPAELAAAALEVFNEKGFAAATLDEVASRAGVSKGTLYLYFDNKEALFEGVIRNTILPSLDMLRGQIEENNASCTARLRAVLEQWIYVLNDSPLAKLPKLAVSDIDKFPSLASAFHREIVAPHRQMLREILSAGIENGEFRAEDPDIMVEFIMSALWMPAISRDSGAFFADRDPSERSYFDTLAGLILRSIQRSP